MSDVKRGNESEQDLHVEVRALVISLERASQKASLVATHQNGLPLLAIPFCIVELSGQLKAALVKARLVEKHVEEQMK